MAKQKKSKKESPRFKFKLHVDVQCGVCRSLIHQRPDQDLPKFCWSCGAAMERFCLKCQKTVEMFFEEWWPGRNECHRTYGPVRRCPWCRSFLSEEPTEED